MRAPSPLLMTARATRDANTKGGDVPWAKPAYALAGVSRPVSTVTATAMTEAVRIGKAPTTTEMMAAAKMAKSRHAGTVNPSGGGTNHIPITRTTITVR